MEQLAEVLVNVASQSPVIALLLYIWIRDKRDCNARMEQKNKLIEMYRDRDWKHLDKLEDTYHNKQ